MKAFDHLFYFFGRRETSVIGLVFAINSFLFGNWVTRIPDVKEILGLTDATLGLALLGAPVGALSVMPVSGWIISRLRLGNSTYYSTLIHMLAPLGLVLANSFATLFLALVYFGLTTAFMDIAMNASAAAIEKKTKRNIMSTCHGMWSLGAMLGSGIGSVLLGLDIGYDTHLVATTILSIIATIMVSKTVLSYHESRKEGDKVFALPNLALLGLAAMAFCILMSEGAIADWSAIYMKETLLSGPFMIGLAYSSYSLFMALGRFSGDFIIPRIGKKMTVFFGGAIATIGLGGTLLIGAPVVAIVGFGLTGLGYACIVPVLFSSAANEPGFSSGTGIASVSIVGYTGFLAGPPVIGFLSESYGMSWALGLVVVFSLIVCLMSLKVTFK